MSNSVLSNEVMEMVDEVGKLYGYWDKPAPLNDGKYVPKEIERMQDEAKVQDGDV